VVADLIRQDVTIHRMTHHEYVGGSGATYRQSSVIEIPFLEHRGEPLAAELAHFADCVRNGVVPRVDGRSALRALRLAEWAVQSALV
jgi:predicted dehydrogenase